MNPIDRNQLKTLKDTLRRPDIYLCSGAGPSPEEAERILREKFKYTDAQINALKEG